MKTPISNITEENFIAQGFSRYLPYWPLFIALLVITMDAAWIYLYTARPQYESTARILIKDEKKGAEDSKALEELNLLSTKKIIENEMDVIQSRTLLNNVVEDLNLFTPVTEEGRFKNMAAYATSPISIQANYNAKTAFPGKIYFTWNPSASKVFINGTGYNLNQWVTTPYGTFRFAPNTNFNGTASTNKFYFQVLDPKSVVASIQDRLKVTTSSRQSSILTITLRDEVPQRAEDILNHLLVVYNKEMLSDKNMVASNTLASVEQRLKSVEHDLDSIENKAERYKSSRGVVDMSEQGKLFLQNVSSNDQKLAEYRNQMAILDQAEQYIHSKNNGESSVPSTAGITDPVLPNMIEKLYGLQLEKETLKKTAGDNYPSVVAITDKIEKMKPSILENIQNQRKNLEASSRNISMSNNSYSSMLQTMPEKERDLIEINRELSIKNSIYSFLLQKREEAVLSHASTVSDSRIIDRAQSGSAPVSPKPKLIYVSAFLLAILLGIGIISLREALNRKIMFRHEIQRLSESPVIGEISAHNHKDAIVIGRNERTFIAEQFRKLRTSLKFIGLTAKRKRLLVTSAMSGEGKSFVSLNLAISLSLTGKKVVLIDADLNNPSLHKKLKVVHDIGLSEYLSGNAEEQEIIHQTAINPNLYFIATGSLPPNSAELMMGTRMEDLLNSLDAQFAYIVLDTAPVGLVTDAYVVAPYCDATLFIVRHNYTPKQMVQQMDEENNVNNLKNIGIVFNDVRARGYTSSTGYGYGHGYLHNDKKYFRLPAGE